MGAGRWTEETEEGGKSENMKLEIGNWKLERLSQESRVEGRRSKAGLLKSESGITEDVGEPNPRDWAR
jgi:hypothetical protein